MHGFSHLRIGQMVWREAVIRTRLVPNHFAFVLGNIRPDLSIKYRRIGHTREESYQFLVDEIRDLSRTGIEELTGSEYAMRMGILCHYLCDYFCFVHGAHFTGSLREHFQYEGQLRHYITFAYPRKRRSEDRPALCGNVNELIAHLTEQHDQYLTHEQPDMAMDAEMALSACTELVCNLLVLSRQAEALRLSFA